MIDVESLSDHDLTEQVQRCAVEVRDRQEYVAEALLGLAIAAEHDARNARAMPPEVFAPTYPAQVKRVEQERERLNAKRAVLADVGAARNARLATRDTESSASRQHYIDTGNYLAAGEAVSS